MDVVAGTEERRKGEGQEGDKLFKRKKGQDGNMARTKSIPVRNPGVFLQVWAQICHAAFGKSCHVPACNVSSGAWNVSLAAYYWTPYLQS